MNKQIILSLTAIVFVLAVTSTQGIDLSQSLDKTSIPYEDQAILTITVEWPGSQASYIFDRPVQPTLEKLRVQRFATSVSSQVVAGGETTQKTFTFTLVPTGSGLARIEPMTIHYVSWPDSIPGDLTTSAMTLTVAAAKPVNKSSGPFAFLPLWGWIVVWVAVATGAGLGAWRFVKAKKSPVPEVKSPVTLVLEGLTQLQAESGSDLKRFQTGLYKLLVNFAQATCGVATSGHSAEEIAEGIKNSSLSEVEKEKITGWILRADREKFSPLPPTPGETIRLESEVRTFFEQMQMKK